MKTPWGYDVSAQLAPIISVEDFNTITGGKFAGNPRVESALQAASHAIRSECGWHITPSLACVAKPVGGGIVLRLPAACVSGVTSVTENGTLLDAGMYEWREDGVMRHVPPKPWSDRWNGVEVSYTAGYDADMVPDLVEAVCSIATGVLTVAPGIISESADGVSISYTSSASSIAAALTANQKAALSVYKVVNAHAS